MSLIHSNYRIELAEAEQLLAIDSKLTLNGFETFKQKWFELGKVCHRKVGFMRIPYLRTIFTSTIEIKEPEIC